MMPCDSCQLSIVRYTTWKNTKGKIKKRKHPVWKNGNKEKVQFFIINLISKKKELKKMG